MAALAVLMFAGTVALAAAPVNVRDRGAAVDCGAAFFAKDRHLRIASPNRDDTCIPPARRRIHLAEGAAVLGVLAVIGAFAAWSVPPSVRAPEK